MGKKRRISKQINTVCREEKRKTAKMAQFSISTCLNLDWVCITIRFLSALRRRRKRRRRASKLNKISPNAAFVEQRINHSDFGLRSPMPLFDFCSAEWFCDYFFFGVEEISEKKMKWRKSLTVSDRYQRD